MYITEPNVICRLQNTSKQLRITLSKRQKQKIMRDKSKG